MSPHMKKLGLDRLVKAGSIEYTKGVLCKLHVLEGYAQIENWILRLLLYRLNLELTWEEGWKELLW